VGKHCRALHRSSSRVNAHLRCAVGLEPQAKQATARRPHRHIARVRRVAGGRNAERGSHWRARAEVFAHADGLAGRKALRRCVRGDVRSVRVQGPARRRTVLSFATLPSGLRFVSMGSMRLSTCIRPRNGSKSVQHGGRQRRCSLQ